MHPPRTAGFCTRSPTRSRTNPGSSSCAARWRRTAASSRLPASARRDADSGPAKVNAGEDAAIAGIGSGEITDGDVIVLRGMGPRGRTGTVFAASFVAALNGAGMGGRVAVVTDGELSGLNYGLVVGQVMPDAAVGGPLAGVQNGDTITIDLEARLLEATRSATAPPSPPGDLRTSVAGSASRRPGRPVAEGRRAAPARQECAVNAGVLSGQVALVTGSGNLKGIGRGIVDALAAEGAAVVVNYASRKQEAEDHRGATARARHRGARVPGRHLRPRTGRADVRRHARPVRPARRVGEQRRSLRLGGARRAPRSAASTG